MGQSERVGSQWKWKNQMKEFIKTAKELMSQVNELENKNRVNDATGLSKSQSEGGCKPRDEENKLNTKNRILVTGGAGFLGLHVLKALVEKEEWGEIWTIVRDPKKMKDRANQWGIQGEWMDKVRVIQGDLKELKGHEWPDVDHVIHSAAQLHGLKSLKALWEDNVKVTEIIAKVYRHQAITFISTLSVFVSSNQQGRHEAKELPEGEEYELYGGYAQSKWIGEKIMRKGGHQIMRLGLLTGSRDKGIAPEGDFLGVWAKAMRSIGGFPKGSAPAWVDMTPVDACAERIVEKIKSRERMIHIANRHSVARSQLEKALGLQEMEREAWNQRLDSLKGIERTLLEYAYDKERMVKEKKTWFNMDVFQSTGHEYAVGSDCDWNHELLIRQYMKQWTGEHNHV